MTAPSGEPWPVTQLLPGQRCYEQAKVLLVELAGVEPASRILQFRYLVSIKLTYYHKQPRQVSLLWYVKKSPHQPKVTEGGAWKSLNCYCAVTWKKVRHSFLEVKSPTCPTIWPFYFCKLAVQKVKPPIKFLNDVDTRAMPDNSVQTPVSTMQSSPLHYRINIIFFSFSNRVWNSGLSSWKTIAFVTSFGSSSMVVVTTGM